MFVCVISIDGFLDAALSKLSCNISNIWIYQKQKIFASPSCIILYIRKTQKNYLKAQGKQSLKMQPRNNAIEIWRTRLRTCETWRLLEVAEEALGNLAELNRSLYSHIQSNSMVVSCHRYLKVYNQYLRLPSNSVVGIAHRFTKKNHNYWKDFKNLWKFIHRSSVL